MMSKTLYFHCDQCNTGSIPNDTWIILDGHEIEITFKNKTKKIANILHFCCRECFIKYISELL